MSLHSQPALALIALALQFSTLTLTCTAQFIPPTPTITPLAPVGIRMSIPDVPGITLVAFHAKINEDFNGLEAGTIARDIVRVKNNRWTYEDRETRLKIGDTVYLWIHVIYQGLGYNLLDQVHHVTKLYGPTGDTGGDCQNSQTIINDRPACAGRIIFEEHFDRLNTSRWRVLNQFSVIPDFEFVVYRNAEENVCTRNGELRIKPSLLEDGYGPGYVRHGNLIIESCTGRIGTIECEKQGESYNILPPVVSGRIDTKESFNFLYGRVEVRAKLPRGNWIYPVIMLEPTVPTYGAGYPSGQLRIASVIGNQDLNTMTGENLDGRVLRGGAVISEQGPIRESTMSKKESSNYWSDDYHIYELEWTPTKISVKVDGENYGEKIDPAFSHSGQVLRAGSNRWTNQNSPFDRSFYLSIGVAVGGTKEFPDNCSTRNGTMKPWGNMQAKSVLNFYTAKSTWERTWMDEASTMKIDYVKIFAL